MTIVKYFLLLLVFLSTLSICYSLQCYNCWLKTDQVCEPKTETCYSSGFLGLFPREAACISGYYQFQGTNYTYRGCDHSSIMNGIFLDDELRVFSYAVCKEDFCNKEEEKVTSNGSKNGLENNYFVVITGFLLTVSAIF